MNLSHLRYSVPHISAFRPSLPWAEVGGSMPIEKPDDFVPATLRRRSPTNKCQPRMSRTLCLILFDSRHLSIQCQNLFWTAPDLPSAKMRPAPKTRNTGEAESKLGHHFIQEKPSSQKSRLNRRDPWTLRLKSS